jgi:asparagine synthase (glutamine-hydrolysing)
MLDGMFALAIWDGDREELVIARDRMGEKPLYVAKVDGGYAVASEIKALLLHPGLDRTVDADAVEQYLAFDYTVGPRTILSKVRKLRAGHVGTVSRSGFSSTPYWRLRFDRQTIAREEALARLDFLLDESVRMRMVADVPVGLFLSGGLDSSTVGYYMRRHSPTVRAFTIGFEERGFDETAYARKVARHLELQHDVEVLSESRVLELLPRITDLLDEPMADPSVLPTHLLSVFTRRSAKVALGGDGSDELLMGYRTYQALKLAGLLDAIPAPIRTVVAAGARRMPKREAGLYAKGRRFVSGLDIPAESRLLFRLGAFGGAARGFVGPGLRGALGPAVAAEPVREIEASVAGARDWADRTVAAYVRTYLQEDILVKVDRASMAASLEVRAPFLAPALIDFLGELSGSLKFPGFRRKDLLRRVMRGRIPDEIIDRPKQGFGAPLDAWFRGPLLGLAGEVLEPGRLQASGLLDPARMGALLAAHAARRADHGTRLWSALQLQLWHERWATAPVAREG